jgi:hypothetical protein
MKTYVSDIIPSLKRFSKKLDSKTVLMNQHWIMVDEPTSSKTVYIFRNQNELLISKNGIVQNAAWDMIDSDTIKITVQEGSFLFNHGFLDNDILALQLDGKSEYAVFRNRNLSVIGLQSVDDVVSFLDRKYVHPKQPIPSEPIPADGNNEEKRDSFSIDFTLIAVGVGIILLLILLRLR